MKIGVISLAFPNFRYDIARKYLLESIERLDVGGHEIICCKEALMTEQAISAELAALKQQNIDLLIVQCGTYSFGSSMMEIIEVFAHTPLLLWGFQEPVIERFTGLPLNSLCGLNMFASFLHKMQKPFSYVYGGVDDERVYTKARRVIKAIEMKTRLRAMRFCVIGGRVPGFYLSNIDEIEFRKHIGPEIVYYSIAALLKDAETIDSDLVQKEKAKIIGEVCEMTSTDEMVEKTARLYLAIRAFQVENRIDAFSIKCWPEFQSLLQCSVCGVVSRLNNENTMTSCEGDISGLATMVMQNLATDSPCFFADLVNINDEGVVKTWHCGSSPVCLARSSAKTKYTEHPTIKQGMGIATQFSMKLGRVTMMKLKESQNGYKLFMAKGTGIEEDRELDANQLDIQFDAPSETVIETIMLHGIEHHYAIAYGDITDTMLEACKWIGIEPIMA